MNIAEMTSSMSYANRLKCGAVVVKNRTAIALGYNGTPEGWDNNCEDENNVTKPEVMHAEENALTKLARSHESADGATMFITHAPCFQCAKLIYASGIKNVFYKHKYRLDEGIVFLEKCNVDIQQYRSE